MKKANNAFKRFQKIWDLKDELVGRKTHQTPFRKKITDTKKRKNEKHHKMWNAKKTYFKRFELGQNHPDPFRWKNHRHEKKRKMSKICKVSPRSMASSGCSCFFSFSVVWCCLVSFFFGWCCISLLFLRGAAFLRLLWVWAAFPLFWWVVLLGFLFFGWCCCFPSSFAWCRFPFPPLGSGAFSPLFGCTVRVGLLWAVLLFQSPLRWCRPSSPPLGGSCVPPLFGWVVLLGFLFFLCGVAVSLLLRGVAFLSLPLDSGAFLTSSVGWCCLVSSSFSSSGWDYFSPIFSWVVLLGPLLWCCVVSFAWCCLSSPPFGGAAFPSSLLGFPPLGGVAVFHSPFRGVAFLPFPFSVELHFSPLLLGGAAWYPPSVGWCCCPKSKRKDAK